MVLNLKRLCSALAVTGALSFPFSSAFAYTAEQSEAVYQSLINFEWQLNKQALENIAVDVDDILLDLYSDGDTTSKIKLRALTSLQFFPSEKLKSFYFEEIEKVKNSIYRKRLFDLFMLTFEEEGVRQIWLEHVAALNDTRLNKHVERYLLK